MGSNKKAILKTILYSNLFQFPLTRDELYSLLFTPTKISRAEFSNALKELGSLISEKKGFFFLKGRDEIYVTRQLREKESKKKVVIARKVARGIMSIPSILFIGISGSVAMCNAGKDDDIDFFIIVRENTLWTSRFFILFLLQFYGVRRTKYATQIKNKVCVNMIIDEKNLKIEKARRDEYTSREIVQLLPLYEREECYKSFLQQNSWYKHYLANYTNTIIPETIPENNKVHSLLFNAIFYNTIIRWVIREIQLRNIRKTQTNEFVSNHVVAFHPHNTREKILRKYNRELFRYSLL